MRNLLNSQTNSQKAQPEGNARFGCRLYSLINMRISSAQV